MPIGTAFHPRTLPLATSLSYREWAGYYAPSSYETHHEHEYNAIRNAAAAIDITPLYKYRVEGRGAARLLDRVVTRDVGKLAVGQVIYTPWCDEAGKVLDDGTVSRLGEERFRLTAAEPNLRWLHRNAAGLAVEIEDVSEQIAALALQGPTSAALLRKVAEADLEALRYFRVTPARIAGVPIEISRTGYTGDLGYELWMPWDQATVVWDALFAAGAAFDLHPAGMLALDVARVEAGLLLLDVDFSSSRKAQNPGQRYSPYELGLGRLVDLDKSSPGFVGQRALREEARQGHARQVVGLEVDWPAVEALYNAVGLAPAVAPVTSRVAVPVYKDGVQVGKATSTVWSPTCKKLIALAQVPRALAHPGCRVDIEVTVEAVRHQAPALVVKTPFYSPPRKTATPPP